MSFEYFDSERLRNINNRQTTEMNLLNEIIQFISRDSYGKIRMSLNNFTVITASVICVNGFEVSACAVNIVLNVGIKLIELFGLNIDIGGGDEFPAGIHGRRSRGTCTCEIIHLHLI